MSHHIPQLAYLPLHSYRHFALHPLIGVTPYLYVKVLPLTVCGKVKHGLKFTSLGKKASFADRINVPKPPVFPSPLPDKIAHYRLCAKIFLGGLMEYRVWCGIDEGRG
jgi:hypothetical protein